MALFGTCLSAGIRQGKFSLSSGFVNRDFGKAMANPYGMSSITKTSSTAPRLLEAHCTSSSNLAQCDRERRGQSSEQEKADSEVNLKDASAVAGPASGPVSSSSCSSGPGFGNYSASQQPQSQPGHQQPLQGQKQCHQSGHQTQQQQRHTQPSRQLYHAKPRGGSEKNCGGAASGTGSWGYFDCSQGQNRENTANGRTSGPPHKGHSAPRDNARAPQIRPVATSRNYDPVSSQETSSIDTQDHENMLHGARNMMGDSDRENRENLPFHKTMSFGAGQIQSQHMQQNRRNGKGGGPKQQRDELAHQPQQEKSRGVERNRHPQMEVLQDIYNEPFGKSTDSDMDREADNVSGGFGQFKSGNVGTLLHSGHGGFGKPMNKCSPQTQPRCFPGMGDTRGPDKGMNDRGFQTTSHDSGDVFSREKKRQVFVREDSANFDNLCSQGNPVHSSLSKRDVGKMALAKYIPCRVPVPSSTTRTFSTTVSLYDAQFDDYCIASQAIEWSSRDLEFFRITPVVCEDHKDFFLRDSDLPDLQIHPGFLTFKTADDATAADDKIAARLLTFMENCYALPTESFANDFTLRLLQWSGFEPEGFFIRMQRKLSFKLETGGKIAAVPDFVVDGADFITVVVVEDKASKGRTSNLDKKPQIACQMLAAFAANNNRRRDILKKRLVDKRTMAGIVFRQTVPTFYIMDISRDLVEHVMKGTRPSSDTLLIEHTPELPRGRAAGMTDILNRGSIAETLEKFRRTFVFGGD